MTSDILRKFFKNLNFDDEFDVIFNNPATILIVNGKKYVSKCNNEPFDEEKGLLMCLAKAEGYTNSQIKKMLQNATRQEKRGIKNGK